jgi:hypothetical protein
MVGDTVAAAPRYAPADRTLPPPWRALVDGNTGYIYYWNPETNITQYDKLLPLVGSGPPLPSGPPPSFVTYVRVWVALREGRMLVGKGACVDVWVWRDVAETARRRT